MTRIIPIVVVLLVVSSTAFAQRATPSAASPSPSPLSSLGQSTVRIASIYGATPGIVGSDRTRANRLVANVEVGHGTGFFVHASGLVVTAKHVVADADAIAVIPAGSDDAYPARVVYSDPRHDLAFLHVAITPPAVVRLPSAATHPSATSQLMGAGFPLDVDERNPALFVGVVGRENNDGTVHAYLPVNPGNSGGPVVDAQGVLVGLVSKGSNPRAGAQGIGVLEPTTTILPALAVARSNLERDAPSYAEGHRIGARLTADVVGTRDGVPLYERTSVALIDQATTGLPSVELGIVLGLHAWNMHIAILEDAEVLEIAELPEDRKAVARRLRDLSLRIVRQALDRAPYLGVTYPAALSILVQGDHSVVVRDTGATRRW